MKAYRILLEDNRLSETQVLAAELRSDARAREYARDRFTSSDHVRAVEVWSGPVRVCSYRADERKAA